MTLALRRLRQDISHLSRIKSGAAEAAELREQVKSIRRYWRRLRDQPPVPEMVAVVERMVTGFQKDFWYHDLRLLTSAQYQRCFVWHVRPTGTHLFALSHTVSHINWARATLAAVLKGPGEMYLYRGEGNLQRVSLLDEVPFQVITVSEDAPHRPAIAR